MFPIVKLLGGIRGTIFAGVAVAALAFGGFQMARSTYYQHQLTEVAAQKQKLVKSLLLRSLNDSTELSKQYEKDLQASKAVAADVTGKLRRAEYKLQQHWTCPVSDTSGAEEARRLREASTGRIIGIGAEADAQVEGLIEANEKLERTIRELLRSR